MFSTGRMGRFSLWVAALVAALSFASLLGCPGDPICPDCKLQARQLCGELELNVTVPKDRGNSFTAPKLIAHWNNAGTPTDSTLSVGTPTTAEPWTPGKTYTVSIKAGQFPAAMCDTPKNGPPPFVAWEKATAEIKVLKEGGGEDLWPVKIVLDKK